MAFRALTARNNENARTTSLAAGKAATTKPALTSTLAVPAAKRTALADRTNSAAAAAPAPVASKAAATVSSRTAKPAATSSRASAAAVMPLGSSLSLPEPEPTNVNPAEPVIEPPVVPFATPEREIPHEDIDADDFGDAQQCAEYAEDIMHHFRAMERFYLPAPDYLSTRQTDMNEVMRGVLIDWLVNVHLKFKLLQETLFLCVNILDRYLSLKQVPRGKIQLVGVTSMLIACKFEEIYAPEIRDFIYISESAYTKDDILKMESSILNTLRFKLLAPYPLHFLRRFSKAAKVDARVHSLAKYLIEVTLLDYKCIRFLPSTVAAASLCLALKMCDREWNSTLEHYSHYTEEALTEVMREIATIPARISKKKLTAVTLKYGNEKMYSVSAMPMPTNL